MRRVWGGCVAGGKVEAGGGVVIFKRCDCSGALGEERRSCTVEGLPEGMRVFFDWHDRQYYYRDLHQRCKGYLNGT